MGNADGWFQTKQENQSLERGSFPLVRNVNTSPKNMFKMTLPASAPKLDISHPHLVLDKQSLQLNTIKCNHRS
jgi:hypothetical protein